MPRGIDKIAKLAKEAKERSDSYASGEGYQRPLMLENDQTCKGRFLEEGSSIWYLYTHEVPKKPGQKYADKTLCLDQPFTLQEEQGYVEGSKPCICHDIELSRPTRVVINFIRYDEPKLVRDAQGKAMKNGDKYVFDGVQPTIVVCNFSTGVGGRLAFLESQKGPLTNHVCTIHKTGDKNNPFMIDVAQENVAPQPWEHELFKKKVEPPKAATQLGYKSITLMTYNDQRRVYGAGTLGSGFSTDASTGEQQPVNQDNNVYARAAAGGSGNLNLGAFGS